QAFYFTDPEGNGVELYHDRPRDQWQWNNGQVAMDTLHIDPKKFISEHLTEEPTSQAGTLGHVHLQVGDIATARAFYVDALGFDQTLNFGGSALFVAAGGYHHHMAMNVWNSAGAGPRASTLGMGVVDVVVPTVEEVDAAAARLKDAGFATTHDGRTLTVLDPWRNEIRLTAV
ncbi:MAG: VOC family protein, partial [Propionibacteriaceae bacterium]|nr:VOC family protein [Propionibacteriaceae bacterium]